MNQGLMQKLKRTQGWAPKRGGWHFNNFFCNMILIKCVEITCYFYCLDQFIFCFLKGYKMCINQWCEACFIDSHVLNTMRFFPRDSRLKKRRKGFLKKKKKNASILYKRIFFSFPFNHNFYVLQFWSQVWSNLLSSRRFFYLVLASIKKPVNLNQEENLTLFYFYFSSIFAPLFKSFFFVFYIPSIPKLFYF